MYNVKGPSNIVAKTRRGLSQNLDGLKEHPRTNRSIENEDTINGPRPVFQNTYKRSNNKNDCENHLVTPQHEEIIKYINDSWNCICFNGNSSPCSSSGDSESDVSTASAVYYEDEPSTALKNFKPFDLESWWGKRLFTYITNSVCTN